MLEISVEVILLLVMAGFVAGFIDAIAGGGGLLTVPALLLAGLPPVEALATNKLQSLFGSGSAVIAYASKGHVNLREQGLSALASALASVAGALLATVLPSEVLNFILPLLLIGIAIYFLIKPNLSDADSTRRIRPFVFALTIVPLIGFYDGAFGPGTGSFFMLAFVWLAGYGVLKATAHTKTLNFASNVGAFITFALVGAMQWKIGLLMGAAQFTGARLGAGLAMKGGAKVIKPLLVTMCVLLATRLLMEEHNPLRVFIGL